jgi:hypothetical protein
MMRTDQLIAELSRDVKPVRARSALWLLMRWLLISGAYLALLLAFYHVRPDLAARLHSPLFALEISSLAGVALASGVSAVALSYPDLRQKPWQAYAPLPFLALFVGVLATQWWFDSSPPETGTDHTYQCLLCIALFSLAPTLLMLLQQRAQATIHAGWAGAVALLASSSLGALTFRLSEKSDSIPHMILWHYLPLAGFGLIGVALGRKWLKW